MNERAGSSELRAENERLRRENMGMREALQNISCLNNCQHQPQSLEALRTENFRLKKEVSFLLINFILINTNL